MRFVGAVVLTVTLMGAARAIDCTPANCDDGDPCTVDTCDASAGCIHLPLPGAARACCRLRMLGAGLDDALALLRGTPAANLGGASVKERLVALTVVIARLVQRIERLACRLRRVDDAGRPCLTQCRRLLERTFMKLCRLTATFDRIIATGIARGTIDRGLGERLLALVPVPSECRPLPL